MPKKTPHLELAKNPASLRPAVHKLCSGEADPQKVIRNSSLDYWERLTSFFEGKLLALANHFLLCAVIW